MKRFLAVYLGSSQAFERSGWNALSDAERESRQRAGIAAWHRWVEANRPSIVENGGPLGKTKRVSQAGIEDTHNALAAYTVVTAESQEAAAELFVGHPHFTIFPGEAVEIMECLPVPST